MSSSEEEMTEEECVRKWHRTLRIHMVRALEEYDKKMTPRTSRLVKTIESWPDGTDSVWPTLDDKDLMDTAWDAYAGLNKTEKKDKKGRCMFVCVLYTKNWSIRQVIRNIIPTPHVYLRGDFYLDEACTKLHKSRAYSNPLEKFNENGDFCPSRFQRYVLMEPPQPDTMAVLEKHGVHWKEMYKFCIDDTKDFREHVNIISMWIENKYFPQKEFELLLQEHEAGILNEEEKHALDDLIKVAVDNTPQTSRIEPLLGDNGKINRLYAAVKLK